MDLENTGQEPTSVEPQGTEGEPQEPTRQPGDSLLPPEPEPGAEPPVEGAEPPPAAFAPDWKVNYRGESHEIPEDIRGLFNVTDEEGWKRVHELYGKTLSADNNRQYAQELKGQLAESEQKLNPITESMSRFLQHRDSDDLDTCFEITGIKPEQVLRWAANYMRANDPELPPEQRAMYNNAQERRRAVNAQQQTIAELQNQNTTLEDRLQSIEAQNQQAQLDQAMSAPEVATMKQAYDQHNGDGAFLNRAKQFGLYHYQTTGEVISPKEAMNRVIAEVQPFMAQPTGGMPQPTHAPQAPGAQTQTKPPVIPNVGSGGTKSPVKKKITSTKEMREYAASLPTD